MPAKANLAAVIARLRKSFTVVEIGQREALDEVLANLAPEALVLDLAMLGLRRAQGLHALRDISPVTKIVALAEPSTDQEGMHALKLGASGYCARSVAPATLEMALTAVLGGELWASRRVLRMLVNELSAEIEGFLANAAPDAAGVRLVGLTERQRTVAGLIAQGATNKDISRRLGISERTVKGHLTEVFRIVGVSDRLQLALFLQGHPRAWVGA